MIVSRVLLIGSQDWELFRVYIETVGRMTKTCWDICEALSECMVYIGEVLYKNLHYHLVIIYIKVKSNEIKML